MENSVGLPQNAINSTAMGFSSSVTRYIQMENKSVFKEMIALWCFSAVYRSQAMKSTDIRMNKRGYIYTVEYYSAMKMKYRHSEPR